MSEIESVTFGCRLNGVESDAMAELAAAGRHGRVAVVNTCAVTSEAVRQARQTIRRLKREDPARPVIVTGCASTIDPLSFSAMPEVERVLANADKTSPAAWGLNARPAADEPPSLAHTRGFLEVQNGCDHRCTFCVIPFGRGASRSIPQDEVIARARAMVTRGVPEIVLTGVDITSYGLDRERRPMLGALVVALLRAMPDLPRLRVSSLDCIEADPLLLHAIATEPRLMPHWHLSLQSGADLVLKRMKRRHTRADAVRFCADLRATRPGIVFGADIIVGFPTETDAMFDDSLRLIEDCGLTHLHVFPFSPRPGTPAARMPAVPPTLVRERAARLREAGARAVARHLEDQRGRVVRVLMERGGRGRAEDFTPLRPRDPVAPGTLTDMVVQGHDGRELNGVPA